MIRTNQIFVVSAATLVLATCVVQAQTDAVQDFETWPETAAWGTHMHDAWVLSDGQVRANRGGFGPPIDTQCGWLNDFDNSSNTWIRSPYLPYGAGDVSFWVRRNEGTSSENFWAVEYSEDATNWTTVQEYDRTQDDWQQEFAGIHVLDPLYVRFVKTGDSGDNQLLGIDDIVIELPPGVTLSDLAIDPPAPAFEDAVHVEAKAFEGPNASNAVLRAFYRLGDTGAFTQLPMTNIGGTQYRTVTSIPAGLPDKVYYYVEAAYDGVGPSPTFLPEGGSNAPAFYDTSSPYLNKELRQLHPSSHRTPLIISEIMFNPKGDDDTNSLEFIEIFNTEPVDKRIGGYRLSGDIDYVFPAGKVIGARSFLVVARDPAALQTAHGIGGVLGPYQGALPNDRGTVRLRNRMDALLLEVNYDTQLPWPIAADGAGHSLLLARPDYGEGTVDAWSAGNSVGGSPAFDDPPAESPLDAILVNEFLAHTDLPQVDFIELVNYGTQAVDISGCTLSDTAATNRFTIPPGTVLPAGGFFSFSQTQLGFSLSRHGDEIYLADPGGTRVIDAVRFSAQQNGVSVGRFPDGHPEFHALESLTPGAANAGTGLREHDIVINEIMYHPISGNDDDEYVELYNRGTNAVDVGNWRFVDGIAFTIPPGTVIPTNGYLVVARNVAELLSRYTQLISANAIGDYQGRLSDRGERIALARPDDPLLPGLDFVIVDEVTYGDGDNWGRWSDGDGSSLELVAPRSDNRKAMNWTDSDETAKGGWTEVDFTGIMANGTRNANALHLMCLQGGECIIDNIIVTRLDDSMVVFDEDFESGIGTWQIFGNHSRSELSTTGGVGGSQAMHVRASGAGNRDVWGTSNQSFLNYAAKPLSQALISGNSVRFTARLRWLTGWPHVTLALNGFWLEAPVAMEIPDDLGSPGLQNSRYAANTGPAICDVTHTPVLPAAGEPAVITARVQDPDGVASVTLKYRVVPSATIQNLPMVDDGTGPDTVANDGIYSAEVSEPAGTRVAFTVEAEDTVAAITGFPEEPLPGAPQRECVIRYGQTVRAGILVSYCMWMTDAAIARWSSIPGGNYSNEPQDFTFVYGPYRVIYAAGARWRGHTRINTTPTSSGAYSIELPERFTGQAEIKIDEPGQAGSDPTRMNEHYAFWLAREIDVPAPQVRFVHVFANDIYRGTYHDLQVPSLDFNESWFNDDDPRVFKDVGWEPPDPFGVHKDDLGRYSMSRYRWYWRKRRADVPNDDFSTIFKLAETLNGNLDAVGIARIKAVTDIRNWAAYFTVCGSLDAWDHYGFSWCHNMYAYVPYHRPSSILIYDVDHPHILSGAPTMFPNAFWPVPDRLFNQHLPFRRACYAVAREMLDGPWAQQRSDEFIDTWFSALQNNGGSDNGGNPVSAPTGLKVWLPNAATTFGGLLSAVNSPFAIDSNSFTTTDHIITLGGVAPVEIDSIRINGIENTVRFTNLLDWTLDVGIAGGTNVLVLEGCDWTGNVLTSDTVTVTVTAPPPSPVGQLLISEIMYHPVEQAGEYIEIYNASPHRFDLRGWRLNGADMIFNGGSIIGPGEYRVAVESRASYQYTYGNVELALGEYSGNLDNGGETLSLQMPLGTNAWLTVDSVTYDDAAPWPTLADGGGQSLQLIDVAADNSRVGNWDAFTVVQSNEWVYRTITGTLSNLSPHALRNTGFDVYADGPGRVRVDDIQLVQGAVPEAGANLLANGDFETPLAGPWTATGNHAGSAITAAEAYEGLGSLEIDAAGEGAAGTDSVNQSLDLSGLGGQTLTLSYWYKQTDDVDDLTVALRHSTVELRHAVAPPDIDTTDFTSPGTSNTVARTLFDFPQLWINEVMPSNTNVIADNHGEYEPWIELFNNDSNAVDLSDYLLSNIYSDPGRWAFPTGVVIGTGERLLVWADGETNETVGGSLHADFRLDSSTGCVTLAREHLGEDVIVDYLDYDVVGENASFGSFPEGDPRSRQIFPTPTPALPNSPTSPPVQVVINEWMSDNAAFVSDPTDNGYDDWFELFNASPSAVHLGGYFLTDDLSMTNKFAIPGGTVIPGGGFLHVWADDGAQENAPGADLHANFKLNNAGEEIGLYAPDGTLLDSVVYAVQRVDESEGRWPDGAPDIFPMSPPTPGASNSTFMILGFGQDVPDVFSVSAAVPVGAVYHFEALDDLHLTNWLLLDVVTADTAVLTLTDTNSPLIPARFYRITQAP